jgi:hypothetical protein
VGSAKIEFSAEYYSDHEYRSNQAMSNLLLAFLEGFYSSVTGAVIGAMVGSGLTGGNFDGGPIVIVCVLTGAGLGLVIDLAVR